MHQANEKKRVSYMTPDHSQTLAINEIQPDDSPDPGTSSSSAYASDSIRRTQLRVALQLLQTAGHIVVIQGEPGMGKNGFLHGLQKRLPENLYGGLLTATDQLDLANLLAALGVTNDEAQRPPLDLLHAVLQENMWPVLLINEAAQLNIETLSALLSLWCDAQDEGIPFSLVLAAPPGFVERLPDDAQLQERLHPINLYPFSEQQTIDYLTQLLPSPLSPVEMRALHARSQGVPARIDAEVQQLLNAGPATPSTKTTGRRTIVLVSAAVLALVVVLIAILQFSANREVQLSEPEILPLPSAAPVQAQPEAQATPAPLALEPATTPEPQTEPQQQESATADITEVAPPATEPDDAQTPTAEEPAPDTATAAAEEEEEQPPAAEPDTTARQPHDWLQARSASAYTIQLVAAHNPEALQQYMKQHQLEEKAVMLQTERNGQPWHIVVLGDYPDRAASRTALQQLPAAVRKDGAWIRNIGELQEMSK